MTKQELKPANDLKNLMITRNLTRKQVAKYTNSSYRSVIRWMLDGIPVIKWDLLNLKLNAGA